MLGTSQSAESMYEPVLPPPRLPRVSSMRLETPAGGRAIDFKMPQKKKPLEVTPRTLTHSNDAGSRAYVCHSFQRLRSSRLH